MPLKGSDITPAASRSVCIWPGTVAGMGCPMEPFFTVQEAPPKSRVVAVGSAGTNTASSTWCHCALTVHNKKRVKLRQPSGHSGRSKCNFQANHFNRKFHLQQRRVPFPFPSDTQQRCSLHAYTTAPVLECVAAVAANTQDRAKKALGHITDC